MTLTLTPDQERKLKAKAARAQKPIEAVRDDLLSENTPMQDLISETGIVFPEGVVYPIYSPYDSHEAARLMQDALKEYHTNKGEQSDK